MISSILIFLVVLSILILAHEFGHFYVARKNGVWVEEFGLGYPPRIWSKKKGNTVYSINILPFGGFVRLHVENTDENLTKPTRAFINKSKKARFSIVIAGVVMNFLLAVFAFAIVYSFSGIPRETTNVKIVEVAQGSPAQTWGVVVGDVVKLVDKKEISAIPEFVEAINEKKGKRTVLTLERTINEEVETKKITLTPRENPPEGEGALGVTISTTEIYFPPIWKRPFVGIYHGFKDALFWGKTITLGLFNLVAGMFKGTAQKGISGPVGIFAVTSNAAGYGILSLINFLGVLSLNLAILNIIPFPALDGGRLFFITMEKFIGKKVLPKVESTIHAFGMIILMILLFAVTIKDIRGLISAGSLSGFVESILK